MAIAVAVSAGGAVAVAVAVAGLTKRFFNHIQKDFLINAWGSEGIAHTFYIHPNVYPLCLQCDEIL